MKIWRKIAMITLWVLAGGSMVFLLIAAGQKKKMLRCSDMNILLNGAEEDYFLTLEDIRKMVVPQAPHQAIGKLVESFPLRKIEAAIKRNIWVKDAELYFDDEQVLQVRVTERVPLMRVFNQYGDSFFVDSSLQALPVDTRIVVKLPVFTGFSGAMHSWSVSDSLRMREMRTMAQYLVQDSFWNTQIAQVELSAEGQYQMVPTVGNHLIVFGDGSQVAEKFHKLMVFYKRVLATAGMEKYKVLNLSYDKQIVATKTVVAAKIDSIQALRKINELIALSKHMANDTAQSTLVDKKSRQIELQESSLRSFDLLPPGDMPKIDSSRLNPTPTPSTSIEKNASIPKKNQGQQNKTTTNKTTKL